MSRTSLIALLGFLLLLTVVCFIAGFLVSKSIHEKTPANFPHVQPIIVHTGAIPPQAAAGDVGPVVNREENSKTAIKEEMAAFLSEEGVHHTVPKVAATPQANAAEGKIKHLVTDAQQKFHSLVGIHHDAKKGGAPQSRSQAAQPHQQEGSSVASPAAPATHAEAHGTQAQVVATPHGAETATASHQPPSPKAVQGGAISSSGWPKSLAEKGFITEGNDAPLTKDGRVNQAPYDLNAYGPKSHNQDRKHKLYYLEDHSKNYTQDGSIIVPPTFDKTRSYKNHSEIQKNFENAGARYAIQISAHRDLKDAYAMRNNYQEKGYDVHVDQTTDHMGNNWFLVRKGGYQTRAIAEKDAHIFAKTEQAQAAVVELKAQEKRLN